MPVTFTNDRTSRKGECSALSKEDRNSIHLEKVEDQGQFQPVSNTGCPWGGGVEICSNTRSEMKGFVTFLDGVAIYCY